MELGIQKIKNMTKKSKKKNSTNDASIARWLIVAFGGFVGGLYPPVMEYREYGEVSAFKMLIPVFTMALGLGTAAVARLVSQQRQD